jgi:hypothetical protein
MTEEGNFLLPRQEVLGSICHELCQSHDTYTISCMQALQRALGTTGTKLKIAKNSMVKQPKLLDHLEY